MTFCRMGLPLPIGAGAHGGIWHAVLKTDGARLKRELTKLQGAVEEGQARAIDLARLRAHGVRYSVTVSSWSNLRMSARVTQTSVKPGAALRLNATLTEYGQPVARRARVEVEVHRPDGVTFVVPLSVLMKTFIWTDFPSAVRSSADWKASGAYAFARMDVRMGARYSRVNSF